MNTFFILFFETATFPADVVPLLPRVIVDNYVTEFKYGETPMLALVVGRQLLEACHPYSEPTLKSLGGSSAGFGAIAVCTVHTPSNLRENLVVRVPKNTSQFSSDEIEFMCDSFLKELPPIWTGRLSTFSAE